MAQERSPREERRLLDWANMIVGLWTFASPWVLHFATGTSMAARVMWMLGGAIIVFSASAVYLHKAWQEIINVLLGIFLIASPWVLGFSDLLTATSSAVVAGLLVTTFAVWAMLRETEVQRWWHERHPTR